MSCPACQGPLAVFPSGSLARCGSCGAHFGVGPHGPVPLLLSAPWPLRSQDELEDEADDRAFDVQAAAPTGGLGKIMRIGIPIFVLVVLIVVAITVVAGMRTDAPSTAPAAPTKASHAAPPAKKK